MLLKLSLALCCLYTDMALAVVRSNCVKEWHLRERVGVMAIAGLEQVASSECVS